MFFAMSIRRISRNKQVCNYKNDYKLAIEPLMSYTFAIILLNFVIVFRLGIYVPEGLKGMAHVMGYKESTRKLSPKKSNAKLGRRPVNYKHRYKNYKPFNPTEIKEKYLYANRKDKNGKPSRR